MTRSTVIGGAVLLVAMTGCAKKSPDKAILQEWSTRDHSVISGQPAEPSLNVSPQATLNAPPEELRTAALDLLMQAADSTNPLLRANALEAMQSEPEHLEAAVKIAMHDENRGVRFVAAALVGKIGLDLCDELERLLEDESLSVRTAAIYGLRQCGRDVDLTPLGEMLQSYDPEIRANAAVVLGELGNPTAIPMIRRALRERMPDTAPAREKMVDLQLAEALVLLGATHDIQAIRAALYAREEEAELTVLACQILGRLDDKGAAADLTNLVWREGKYKRQPELRMAATAALAEIDPARARVEVPMEYARSELYLQRAQAAHTMGVVGDLSTLPMLSTMLSDPNPVVQVSAAGAVLQVYEAHTMRTEAGNRRPY